MLTVVVFGASGDLAKRKTLPALFALYRKELLPAEFRVFGYARSNISQNEFNNRIEPFLKKSLAQNEQEALVKKFLEHCEYISGEYDKVEDFKNLKKRIWHLTVSLGVSHPFDNVILFYLALPPSVFISVTRMIHSHLLDPERSARVIIEKPFGRDLQSSNELSEQLLPLFPESQIYRIDHYLGKEMVKNLMILRFANIFFSSVWNRHYIANVQIVFKETLGVEGRGGYFDEFGIIRDVMQNHIMQMLTVVAMERPTSLDAEDVRDEKVKILRSIRPLELTDVILGQYTKSVDETKLGYLDDETVPKNSNTPTFAMATVYVDNERWAGVPFVLRCGKGLNEQKAEIRIQFADVPGCIFPEPVRNELVIRVQPNESVYMKMMVKKPGLESQPIVSDLDLSYASRYVDLRIPEAYEALLMDAIKGDRSNFVRADELEHAWRIFTPILHEIESKHVQPIPYPCGSRGPIEADVRLVELGFKRYTREYVWPRQQLNTA